MSPIWGGGVIRSTSRIVECDIKDIFLKPEKKWSDHNENEQTRGENFKCMRFAHL